MHYKSKLLYVTSHTNTYIFVRAYTSIEYYIIFREDLESSRNIRYIVS